MIEKVVAVCAIIVTAFFLTVMGIEIYHEIFVRCPICVCSEQVESMKPEWVVPSP